MKIHPKDRIVLGFIYGVLRYMYQHRDELFAQYLDLDEEQHATALTLLGHLNQPNLVTTRKQYLTWEQRRRELLERHEYIRLHRLKIEADLMSAQFAEVAIRSALNDFWEHHHVTPSLGMQIATYLLLSHEPYLPPTLRHEMLCVFRLRSLLDEIAFEVFHLYAVKPRKIWQALLPVGSLWFDHQHHVEHDRVRNALTQESTRVVCDMAQSPCPSITAFMLRIKKLLSKRIFRRLLANLANQPHIIYGENARDTTGSPWSPALADLGTCPIREWTELSALLARSNRTGVKEDPMNCPQCGRLTKRNEPCWYCAVHRPPIKLENTSTNVGVPEKRRGWEQADIQYHGDMWFRGEW